jgi:thioredoxin reductase
LGLSDGGERPFPPGRYGVVVVGSGPGGLQTGYWLRRLGVDHAVLSADDEPGGMFRRFPLFERLISWTHAEAQVDRSSRAYELHDQNSLVSEEPQLRALVAEHMAIGHRRPAREEMAAGLRAFAERAVPVRYGCRWESTSRVDDGLVLGTSDGEYACRAAVFAVGMTEPWVPAIPGLGLEHHYVNVDRGADRYRDRRVVIVGKRNSAFEVGEALVRQGVRELTLVSPRSPEMSRLARSPLRPWYLTAYDEHLRGAPGRYVLDRSVERVERGDDGYRIHTLDPAQTDPLVLEADEVVAATGFEAPLRDLRSLGLATVNQDRLPALTPYWESATVPGAFFAGNVTQAAPGLRMPGVANLSGMVCGFRYNARVLAERIAVTVFGIERERPRLPPGDVAPFLVRQLSAGPELWMQKGYLARVLTIDPAAGMCDEGIVPLEVFIDGGADGIAATLEYDETETLRPWLYVRAGGKLHEEVMPAHPLRRYDGVAYRAVLEDALRTLVGG